MLFLTFLLFPLSAFAETSVEIIPGVTHYGNHSSSVEIIPGHRVYQGEVQGSVTELTPGISSYHLEKRTPAPSVAYPPSLDEQHSAPDLQFRPLYGPPQLTK